MNEEVLPEGAGGPSREQAIGMYLLGVDYGAARIGLAIKPPGQDWALPSKVLEPANEADGIRLLRAEIVTRRVEGVVVGLPVNADPMQARLIKKICRKAREGMQGVRWFFVDETLTSQAAEWLAQLDEDADTGAARDDVAAKLILETFMQGLR